MAIIQEDKINLVVSNPVTKTNVTILKNDITAAERAKLDGIESGADVTDANNVRDAGAVMTTGDQSIGDVKTFTDGITIDNQANVNFNQSTTIFGTSAEVRFEGIDPQFKTDSVRFNGSSTQLLKKEGSGDFNIENQGGGNLTITNAASGTTKLKSSSGDLILESGQGVSDRVKINARDGIEVKLSHDNVNVSSPFKIIDANTQAGTETEVFTVDRSGDVIIKDANDNEIFSVKTSAEPGKTLDFVRIGGDDGYKFPAPESNMTNKNLVVGSDGKTLEFRDAQNNTIGGLSDVDTTGVQDGKILVYNTDKFVVGDVPDTASINSIGDVDTTTTSPQTNYALVWTGSRWEPRQQIDTNTTNLSTDASPTLSANLDVSGNSIVTTSGNQNISINPHGTGNVSLGNFVFDVDQDLTGKDNYVLTYDAGGTIQLEPTALDLSGLSDVDTTGVSEGDVLVADSSGDFSPSSAFNAFMTAAVSVSTGMPQNGSVAGDFDNDGLVNVNDLLIFLGNYGESAFDGNTQIEFTDMTPSLSSVFNSNFTYDNYNTQTSITTGIRDMQQYELEGADVTTSIAPYTWQVSTSSDSIKLYTSNSTQFGEWFETANVELKNPSSIYHSVGDNSLPVSFAVYVEILREYPTAANETEVKMIADYTSVENLNFLIEQDEVVSFADAFKKDSGNTERPKAVTFKFYFAVADDAWGVVSHRFNNLKLKVTGPV